MVQQRKSHRFYIDSVLEGNFLNNEKFLVKDISQDGLNLISNFLPFIGGTYRLKIKHKAGTMVIEFQVLHVEDAGYNAKEDGIIPMGVLYSVGGKILDLDESKNKIIMSLILGR